MIGALAVGRIRVAQSTHEDDIPHCLAGHVRFELRNVGENYPFENSRGFPGSEPNSAQGDHSRLSCSAGISSSGFCRDLQQAFCTDVGHPCRHQSRDDAQMRMSELIALAFLAITGSAASGEIRPVGFTQSYAPRNASSSGRSLYLRRCWSISLSRQALQSSSLPNTS